MFCTKCGTKVSDDTVICPNCGTKIQKPAASTSVPQYKKTNVKKNIDSATNKAQANIPIEPTSSSVRTNPPSAQPLEPKVNNHTVSQMDNHKKSAKKHRGPMIGIIVVVIAMIIIIAAIYCVTTGISMQSFVSSDSSSDIISSNKEPDISMAPEDVSITDYTIYEGTYTESGGSTASGVVVKLWINENSLAYNVMSISESSDQVASITGHVPMDGTAEIPFYGDDDCLNTVSGTIYLLRNNTVAVESEIIEMDETTKWGLEIPYTVLMPTSDNNPTAPKCTQELLVSSSNSFASITLRNWDDGQWHDVMTADAMIGDNGTTENKVEGDRSTPAGTFDILFAFGTANQQLKIPYVQIIPGDVWVCDSKSVYYNTLQNTNRVQADWDASEDMYQKFVDSRSVACIYFDFNGDGRTAGSAYANGGSALFLDGIGNSGDMASGYGDIKISATDMEQLLSLLDADRNPCITIS